MNLWGIGFDGSTLASAQYECDLVRRDLIQSDPGTEWETKLYLRKPAPLYFFDYGRAKMGA